MPFGALSVVPDIISHAKLCANRLRGFLAAAPPKAPFPIFFRTTLTSVIHYRADCDEKLGVVVAPIASSVYTVAVLRIRQVVRLPIIKAETLFLIRY